MLKPAFFLDRDGTLSHEVGYVNHVSRFRLYPWAVDAVRTINRAGWLAVVVTNQAGVAHGYFPETLILEVNETMRAAMMAGGARLDGIYFCPHHPTSGPPELRLDCECRKPKPGLVIRAARELGIDVARSWTVGDKPADVRLAWNTGARACLVKTGYGLGELLHNAPSWPRQPDLVTEHVLEAVQEILAREGRAA
jgi:D-glycero-D-manno-heptose 1,7-bisphosphate phosphatase